ncbi:VOC family protein [Amycolatopsis nigrescens]|uniref:VOC family protein n=1 Tax=Amycolatopsis nigrescens TaxID=381445 RepID=UPI001B7FB76D|nr:VOC family protein [Amycolatopsis nigrescens]
MSVTPYVMVDSAKAYQDFLEKAFEAEVSNVIPLPEDPERMVHAEARIGTGVVFFADSGAGGMRCLESPSDPVHVQLWATLPDPEAAFARAVDAGAKPAMEVAAQEDGSRMGGVVDPFGTLWWLTTNTPG